MESKEKSYKKIKLGLALKRFMGSVSEVDSISEADNLNSQGKKKSISFRKLESASGIRHATIVDIVNGKKNPAWSTMDALLEGLEITLSKFAFVYDNITEQEVLQYKKDLEKRKQKREKARKK